MINSKTKFRSFIIVVALPGFFVAACGGGGNYKIVEQGKGKGVMQRFYPDGKIRYEAEVNIIPDDKIGTDSNSHEKYVMNGFRKEYYANGKLSTLSFMKNGSEDHHCNTYTFYENGQLNSISHDTFKVLVKEGRGPNYGSANKTFTATVADVGPQLKAPIANIFRVFKRVSGNLHVTILNGENKPVFDTIINDVAHARWDNFPDCAIIFPVTFPAKGDFKSLVQYTLTDSISNIRIITDTMLHAVRFYGDDL